MAMIDGMKVNEELRRSYYEKGYWTERTLLDVWEEQAARHAAEEYVADDRGARYTYGQIDEAARRLASWLAENGVGPGDAVTFQVPVWAEFCIVYVACLMVGAIMHPVPRNFNENDLAPIMNLVGPRAFICPTFHHGIDHESLAEAVGGRVPSLRCTAVIEKGRAALKRFPALADVIASREPLEPSRFARVSSDDVACVLSTSGTTGKSKAVMLTHNNIIFSEKVFTEGLGRTRDDVMFMMSPLNHATGFFHGLIAPMMLGGRVFLQQDFDARRAIQLMNAEGATWSMGATPFIYDMLKAIEEGGCEGFGTLQLFPCGGAPLPSSLVERAHRHGVELCEIYGSTESCPHVFVPPEKCAEWNGTWSGAPFPGIEIRVVDEQGRDVPPGVQGEEISRGPHQFVGYLHDRAQTDAALDDEGWFHSGDLCYADEQGRIRINGRKKEVIIRGGENICAREIDDDLLGCPGIGDHATIGMPDERLGERICTFYVASNACGTTLDDVKAYLADHGVAKRLWPERLERIDAIPYTPTGKVKRFLLAEELERRMKADGTLPA